MGKKAKIQKSIELRLADCEDHLFFLWDAHRLYPTQKERYKQIATELRVLVADHRPSRRVLIALMEELGFSYDVQPPGSPFENQPIPLVGWKDDPEHQALAEELQQENIDQETLDALLLKQATMRQTIPFGEYVDKALAVYIAPYDYSYGDLVRSIAQQMGSAHEDIKVDEPLVQLSQIIIGGDEGHIAPLIGFAKLVIAVGSQFIEFVAEKYGYQPKHFKVQE